ncbi:MAG TPA: rRNA adenine dimethyltransferase family protein [Nitrososphaerales archaeon]|nr:rRNA adenine dimethyltransferase family protein [Nitrososphaerales archaeon]
MKRRRLGQHYLIDSSVRDRMISLAQIRPSDSILEIGTGRGELTSALTERGNSVVGYEVDRDNFLETRRRVKSPKLTLHMKDVFEEKPSFDVLVASLPYSRSGDFIEWLSMLKYRRAVVLLQQDFVKKITSGPGENGYRAVSVIAQISSNIEVHSKVGMSSFDPRPKVGSSIVSFTPKSTMTESEIRVLKKLFALRRRTLGAVLRETGIELDATEILLGSRLGSLSPETIHGLLDRAVQNKRSSALE